MDEGSEWGTVHAMTSTITAPTPPRVETDVKNVDFSVLPRARRGELKSELRALAGFDFSTSSDSELDDRLAELRAHMSLGDEEAYTSRAEAMALLGEFAARSVGLRPYLVQYLGALVLSDGEIAEMATGEGKTLALAIAAAWAALAGHQVHVMTANDYLAARDAETMGPLFTRAGLTVGVTLDGSARVEQKRAYQCDVIYGTAVQFGFDYLIDHQVLSANDQVQQRREWAFVDEADALLLDEARVPLIISGPRRPALGREKWAAWAKRLPASAYEADHEIRSVWLTPSGIISAEKVAGVSNLYEHPFEAALAQAALHVQVLLERDRDYLVGEHNGQMGVYIVDESTGRVLEGRRWQDGLHEAIEAKEGLEVTGIAATIASVTIPAYLRNYGVVGGMTGTAKSAEEELAHLYDLQVVEVPTHRPRIRQDLDDLLYVTTAEKLEAMTRDVTRYHEQGRPVLIGAPTVEDAELISAHLNRVGMAHQVLSARDHAKEAQVIAQAGRVGAVTVATNMAGRGVDILLGGDPVKLAESGEGDLSTWSEICERERAEVIAAGGLVIMATARHSSKRIDDQLRGRSGRQGEPGTTQFYLSCEDELLAHFGSGRMGTLLERVTRRQGEALSHRMVTGIVDDAQKAIETIHTNQREQLSKFDATYGAQQNEIYRFRDLLLTRGWRENIARWAELADEQFVLEDTQWPFVGDPLRDAATGEIVGADPADTDPRYLDEDEPFVPAQVEDRERAIAKLVERFEQNSIDATDEIRDTVLRSVLVRTVDANWQGQLYNLDSVRTGINLRQRLGNPVAQFGIEAHQMFERMLRRMLASGVVHIRGLTMTIQVPDAPEEVRDDVREGVTATGNEQA